MGSVTRRKALMGKLNDLNEREIGLLLRLAQYLEAARTADSGYTPEADPTLQLLLQALPPEE
jgi:hypothetical protein